MKSKPAPRRPGREKPCKQCGKAFWCVACRDVGGSLRERFFCSIACRVAYNRRDDVRAALFWKYVKKTDGCWLWTGWLLNSGYGETTWHLRKITVHRLSYILANGPIPKGKLVLHSCHVPTCVNPAHLRLGTDQDNMNDKVAAGRQTRGEAMTWKAKLTEAQVRQLRAEYRKTGPRKSNIEELVKKYGVAKVTAYAAATGRSWRHIK